MKPGLPLSVGGHVIALVAGIIALPYAMETTSEELPIIPIELVTIGDETNIRAAVEEEQPEPPPEEPAAEEQPEPPAQELVDPAPTPPAPPPEPAPEPEPVAAEEPVPEEEEEPEPEPEPEETTRPTPPAEEEPEEFSLDNIANLVDRARQEDQPQTERDTENPPEQAEQARDAVGLGTQMTISEIDALRVRINQCWRNSADAPNPDELVVQLRVRFNRDGSLAGPPQVQNAGRIAASGNPYLRIAADRAVRAVTECAPYSFLSPERYSSWREVTLNFDSVIH